MEPPLIVPSVLPADFSRLGEDCLALERAGADRLQWDVMDGRFVPNLTFGPDVVAACRAVVSLPFEAHLMVAEPERLLSRWPESGCDLVIVHAEACDHLHRTLCAIRDLGARAGVALNPATPVAAVEHVVDRVDLLLVMTVDPGLGGQRYLSSMEPKVRRARRLADGADHPVAVEVDGGIDAATVRRAAHAGATVFCAGTAVFRHPAGAKAAIDELRRHASLEAAA